MTPAGIIAQVRNLIQDSSTPYRYSDSVLLGYVNQALKRMAILRPDLFGVLGDITTTADSAVQALPSTAIRLIDIYQVKNGNAITEVDRETLSRCNPTWMTETAGVPVNYMRHVKNPQKFFLYPRPIAGTVLVAEYANTPLDYTINDTIVAPPDSFMPVVVDATVFLAQSEDDEHVNSNRAKLFLDLFTQELGASLQSRTITDTKTAGMKASYTTSVITGEVI